MELSETKILKQLWVVDFEDGMNLIASIGEDTETGKFCANYRFRYPDGRKNGYAIKNKQGVGGYSIESEDLPAVYGAFEAMFEAALTQAPSKVLNGVKTLVFKSKLAEEQIKELNDSGLVDIGMVPKDAEDVNEQIDEFLRASRSGKHANPTNEELEKRVNKPE